MKCDDRTVEECYEKCRAILSVLDMHEIDVCDRTALIWAAREYLERLGYAIGIVTTK